MKNLFFLAVICLVAAACSNEESMDSSVNLSGEQVMAPVKVRIDGVTISQEGFNGRRAVSVNDYTGVKMVTLAFYRVSDGTEVYKCTHIKEDPNATYTTFGEFSTSLPLGSYTMVVLAYSGNHAITLTSPTAATYGSNQVMDTFADTQEVVVNSISAVNLSATLDRIVAALGVQSTDIRPTEITQMRITYTKGGKNFNPTTGAATVDTGFQNLIVHSGSAGSTIYAGGFLFLATDEETMNVTIETLDAQQHVITTKTVNDVPLKRNRVTILTGAIYDVNASIAVGSIQINSGWLADFNKEF
ncbi:MAG: hypothetical protein E7106_00485 [Prevotella sp.]|nr:hypothetical protein [Prevotella sp.]